MTDNLDQFGVAAERHFEGIVRARFDRPANPEDRLVYHAYAHSWRVARDAAMLAERMGCRPSDVNLARVGGFAHDAYRTWREVSDAEHWAVRRADSPLDESGSAAELVRFCLRYDATGAIGPASHEVAIMVASIMATSPRFGPVDDVTQPLLDRASHPVVRAVALADINAAALAFTSDRVFEALCDMDRIFRERELGIERVLRSTKMRSELSSDVAARIRERITLAMYRSTMFLCSRESRLNEELGTFCENPRVAEVISVRNLRTVQGELFVLIRKREQLGFWELLADMGYEIPGE